MFKLRSANLIMQLTLAARSTNISVFAAQSVRLQSIALEKCVSKPKEQKSYINFVNYTFSSLDARKCKSINFAELEIHSIQYIATIYVFWS